MNVFAENIKKLRAAKNISQEEMASKIGVHATHLSRYERGLSNPSIEVVKRMADVLDVSIDELVSGNLENKLDQSINDRELVGLFKKVQTMGQKQKETIKDLITAYVLKNDLQQQLAV